MLGSPYRKEWLVEFGIAKTMISAEVGSRIHTISEYVEMFSCSRGVVQNALAALEGEKVIRLDRQGKRGTFLTGKEEKYLYAFSGLKHLTGSMPPPINRHFAGIATGICSCMNQCPIPFTFAFVQGSENRIEALLAGAYDFVVTTQYAAQVYAEKYPDVEIAFALDSCQYSLPYKLYINGPGFTEIQDGMTVAIDPTSFDQAAMTRKLCEGKDVQLREMPLLSAAYSFYTGGIDCLVFRDGIENGGDNLLNLVLSNENKLTLPEISEISLDQNNSGMQLPVVVVHRKNIGMGGILHKYISGDQVGEIQQRILDGIMVPQFY